jgi:phage FluMu protein Com
MKATICDRCKEITTKPETVRYKIGKQSRKGELCDTCARKMLDLLGVNEPSKPKPQPAKIAKPATEKLIKKADLSKTTCKSLKDIRLALAPSEPPAAKGFLYMKCPNCGEVKGFNAKQEIDRFYCNACNTESELKNLTDLYSRCECGRAWHYLTNITDEMFDIPCLECGNPVAVIFNPNSGAYENIKNKRNGKAE